MVVPVFNYVCFYLTSNNNYIGNIYISIFLRFKTFCHKNTHEKAINRMDDYCDAVLFTWWNTFVKKFFRPLEISFVQRSQINSFLPAPKSPEKMGGFSSRIFKFSTWQLTIGTYLNFCGFLATSDCDLFVTLF